MNYTRYNNKLFQKKIADALQNNVLPGTLVKIESQVTSRGFRQGGIIDKYNHSEVSVSDTTTYIRHFLANTSVSYYDYNNPIHRIRVAIREQSSYYNLKGEDYFPRLSSLRLVNFEDFNSFIAYLYLKIISCF